MSLDEDDFAFCVKCEDEFLKEEMILIKPERYICNKCCDKDFDAECDD